MVRTRGKNAKRKNCEEGVELEGRGFGVRILAGARGFSVTSGQAVGLNPASSSVVTRVISQDKAVVARS